MQCAEGRESSGNSAYCILPSAYVLILNSPLLGRAATVVWKRSDVFNAGDLEAGILKVQHCLLATGAWAFHLDLNLNHAVLARLAAGLFGGAAGGKRRALTRALEPDSPRRGPGDRLPVGIGDGDHRVVEGR